jgi:hypothetical protein
VDNSCRKIAIWNPKALIRSWKQNNIARHRKPCYGQLIDQRFRPHCGLRLPGSSPWGGGQANNVPTEVSKRFPDHGFDRLRTSFRLAHQHRALNSGDTEVSQPIHVSVCRQSTLCLFPDEKGIRRRPRFLAACSARK